MQITVREETQLSSLLWVKALRLSEGKRKAQAGKDSHRPIGLQAEHEFRWAIEEDFGRVAVFEGGAQADERGPGDFKGLSSLSQAARKGVSQLAINFAQKEWDKQQKLWNCALGREAEAAEREPESAQEAVDCGDQAGLQDKREQAKRWVHKKFSHQQEPTSREADPFVRTGAHLQSKVRTDGMIICCPWSVFFAYQQVI